MGKKREADVFRDGPQWCPTTCLTISRQHVRTGPPARAACRPSDVAKKRVGGAGPNPDSQRCVAP